MSLQITELQTLELIISNARHECEEHQSMQEKLEHITQRISDYADELDKQSLFYSLIKVLDDCKTELNKKEAKISNLEEFIENDEDSMAVYGDPHICTATLHEFFSEARERIDLYGEDPKEYFDQLTRENDVLIERLQ